jgi:uncharacterized membrane protein YkvA (DUF1232 family)
VVVSILIGLGLALAAVLVLCGLLLVALRCSGHSLGEAARLFPDTIRLAAALYRDRTMPSAVRWRLRIALIYNLQPINLIPDAIPGIGFADNLVVLAWALRGAVRVAGPDAVARHWKGSPASLAVLYSALRLSGASTQPHALRALPAIGSAVDGGDST